MSAGFPMPYSLRRVRSTLLDMGAEFSSQKGRPHAVVRYGGRTARWPNPHDDPIDDWLLNHILKPLGISRKDFFSHYK